MMGSRNITQKISFVTITLIVLNVFVHFDKCEGQPINAITLFNENDEVLELFDESIDTIINSGKIWIVEFYAHWCGHCQRFAPVWKKVAKKFSGKLQTCLTHCF